MVTLPETKEPVEYLSNPILFWNQVGLELNRLTHSIAGPQTGPALSATALGMLHLAIHDAWFAIKPKSGIDTYLKPGAPLAVQLPGLNGANDAVQAVAGAAFRTLELLYTTRSDETNFSVNVTNALKTLLVEWGSRATPPIDRQSPSFRFGRSVAWRIVDLLAVRERESGAQQENKFLDKLYDARKSGPFQFREDPTHPVRVQPSDPFDPAAGTKVSRMTAYGPFYGDEAIRVGVSNNAFALAPPPKPKDPKAADYSAYIAAFRHVAAKGGAQGAPGTTRTADETVTALFWAYDGANLIGTPPRLYNQILRKVAWENKPMGAPDADGTIADFARLFALANAAMTDAGIFCWREKYRHEYWRPLSGIREHEEYFGGAAPAGQMLPVLVEDADPFWDALGAPDTNSNQTSFKPPFPAYPSGHATFGAACFQIARLYYKQRDGLGFEAREPDSFAFEFVSEELNGSNRDLYQPFNIARPLEDQPGDVRSRLVRRFPSLWAAIYDNAISRIYLGVHWSFDAFAVADGVQNGEFLKDVSTLAYQTNGAEGKPVGGVPLGLLIAEDIFQHRLTPAPEGVQPGEMYRPANPEPDGTSMAAPLPAESQIQQRSTNIR